MGDPEFGGVELALTTLLMADSAFAELVGTNLFGDVRKQGTGLPAAVLHTIGEPTDYGHGGDSGWGDGRYQLDCLAATKPEARTLARHARRILSGFQGPVVVDGQTIAIDAIFVDGGPSNFDGEDPDKVFRRVLDLVVQAREPEPT